jgi:Ca-activated chloride channel family protein
MLRHPGLSLVMCVAAAAGLLAQEPARRDNQLFRSGIEITGITATVRDSQGRLVSGLGRDAFQVFEDGYPQKVTQFTNERVPVSLGVLLDTSDSMFGQRIKEARVAVEHFLFDLLNDDDEYCVLSFNHEPHILRGWTNTPDVMRRALDGLRPWGGTAVNDAVIAALPLVAKRSRQRAALLIISDGADTASDASLRMVHTSLLQSDAFVYAIAIDSPDRRPINAGVNPTALRGITDDSGGRTEVVQSTAELGDATARIADELNHQYLLGYTSTHGGDGQYHSIRVRVADTDYHVRARNGYVATPAGRGR